MCKKKCMYWLIVFQIKTLHLLDYLSELFRQIRKYWTKQKCDTMPTAVWQSMSVWCLVYIRLRIPETLAHKEIRAEWTFPLVLSPSSYCGELSAPHKRAWFHSHSVCHRQCDCCQIFWSEEMLFKSWESRCFFLPLFCLSFSYNRV